MISTLTSISFIPDLAVELNPFSDVNPQRHYFHMIIEKPNRYSLGIQKDTSLSQAAQSPLRSTLSSITYQKPLLGRIASLFMDKPKLTVGRGNLNLGLYPRCFQVWYNCFGRYFFPGFENSSICIFDILYSIIEKEPGWVTKKPNNAV